MRGERPPCAPLAARGQEGGGASGEARGPLHEQRSHLDEARGGAGERCAGGERPLVLSGGGGLLQDPYDARCPVWSLGQNTGNLLFMSALRRIFPAAVFPHDYRARGIDVSAFCYIVTSDLIWINPNEVFPAVEQLLDDTDAPVIPLSVGLQAPSRGFSFPLHPRTVRLLARLQERALLGARGEYTAEVLAAHGIRNVQPVGCPSLYWPMRRSFRVERSAGGGGGEFCAGGEICAAANFRTFYGRATPAERAFLRWCARYGLRFVEQTELPFTADFWGGEGEDFARVRAYLDVRRALFAGEGEWRAAMAAYHFSIGMRFHGNVMAVRAGVPALFLRHDARTAEMIDFFRLPSMESERFDEALPIEAYCERADYRPFNAAYPARFDAFLSFLRANGLAVRADVD